MILFYSPRVYYQCLEQMIWHLNGNCLYCNGIDEVTVSNDSLLS